MIIILINIRKSLIVILNKFKKYLDTIYLNISEFKSNTNYDNIIETLKTYMNIIYNYYDKIEFLN